MQFDAAVAVDTSPFARRALTVLVMEFRARNCLVDLTGAAKREMVLLIATSSWRDPYAD